MNLARVAIVGRPNVGKSSVFNWLAGKRIAIVEPTAGVTRDRIATIVETEKRAFELIDTGGMGIQDADDLTDDVERQIGVALREADAILFLVDVRSGLVPLDQLVADRLRRLEKPVVLAANKCDFDKLDPEAADFYSLAFGDVICISAQSGRNKKTLVQRIETLLPETSGISAPEIELKLAIVGRRNVGKSTFINCLAQEERVIVSEVPGTTRDSVDVRFERDGKVFIAIDTAGVRRKGSVKHSIEFYSVARAERSIRRADVVLHFHDARHPVSKVDKQLAGYIAEHHKPAVFVVNKWDLAKTKTTTGEYAEYLQAAYPGLHFVPFAFITAKSGKNVYKVLNLAQTLHKQASQRVSTGDLNRVLRDALLRREPPMRQNRRPKIYYATQILACPPTIVLFTNGPELFPHTYQRYLLNQFRDHLPFEEVPIKLVLRNRHSEGKEGGAAKEKSLDDLDAAGVPEDEPDTPKRKRLGKSKSKKSTPDDRSPQLWQDV